MGKVRGLVMLGALACNGHKDTDHPGTETGTSTTGPLQFTFNAQLPAQSYEAEVTGDALVAHQISTMFLASAALVAADEKVQDRLNVDGGGGYLRAASLACWDRPEFPMFSFAIDYTPCGSYDIGGGVFIEDHPSGPLLFEYQDFQIKDRTLGGVMALDTRGAYDDGCTTLPCQPYWVAYNTDSMNPGIDNPVALGATIDGITYGVSYAGGASTSILNQEWSMWGVLTIGIDPQDSYNTFEVVHGGVVPGDVPPDQPPGADVDQSSLNWLACRCPTSGIEAQSLPLHFTKVTIDIDDLEDVPDAIDDPSLDLDIDYELPGDAVLTHTGCGEYDVDYTSAAVEIPVSRDQLLGAISFQCATLAIDDENRCNALINAANRMNDGVTVTVTTEQANTTALDAVNNDFDTTWCKMQ